MAFRRINFFKGFFTRADDWQAAEAYHIEKRQLHNRMVHEHGIVEGLGVKAQTDGQSVTVAPGMAIDGQGREIVLEQERSVPIPFDSGKDTIHVVLVADEAGVDFRQDAANTDYSGFAFVEEGAKVTTTVDAPDGKTAVVLARIKLAAGAQKIRNADDPEQPKDNDIDLRVRKPVGSRVSTVTMGQIAELVLSENATIPASRGSADEQYTSRTWRGSVDRHSFHFASVIPTSGDDAEISWRLGSSRKPGGALDYRLLIRNHSKQQVVVEFQVFRVRG